MYQQLHFIEETRQNIVDESRCNTPIVPRSRSCYHEDYSYTGSPKQDHRRLRGKAIDDTSRQWPYSSSESLSNSPKPKKPCREEDRSDKNITRHIKDSLLCQDMLNTCLLREFIVTKMNLNNYDDLSNPREHI
jgi:hypothetical protein